MSSPRFDPWLIPATISSGGDSTSPSDAKRTQSTGVPSVAKPRVPSSNSTSSTHSGARVVIPRPMALRFESGAITASSTSGSSSSARRMACKPVAPMPSSFVSRTFMPLRQDRVRAYDNRKGPCRRNSPPEAVLVPPMPVLPPGPPRAAAQASPERSVSLGSGAWSWFSDPRGMHHRGRHCRTYVGWIDGRGSVVVASMDLDTGARRKAILKREMQRDDHINPSLHVRADGRIMAFYGPHGGPRAKMYYRVTRRPEDITSWGPTHTMSTNSRGTHGFCYSNPLQIGGWTYVFWRGGNLQPTYSRSSDGGRTWSRAREMISAVDGRATRPYMRPYVKYATDGGRSTSPSPRR